jgi:hypothetical protein
VRITIEPTCDQSGHSSQACQTTVSAEHPHDDLTWREMLDLFAGLLKAQGYCAADIDQFMEGEDGNEG